MIHILICGEDAENDLSFFIIKEKIAEISDNNYKFLSFKDKDFILDFQREINKKLWDKNSFVAICDFRLENGWEPFYAMLRNYSPDVIFIFKEKPAWFLKILKEEKISCKIHQIAYKLNEKGRIGKANFRKWAEEMLNKYQVKLHPLAFEKLCGIFINSPSQFLTEIKKLSYYKRNQLIKTDEIKALIRQPNESRIFEMIDYLEERDFGKFFSYLKREIIIMGKSDKELLSIFGLLGATIYRMLLLKKGQEENRLSEINSLNPYYKNKLLLASRKFTEKELKYIYNIVTTLEKRYKKYQIKASDMPEEMLIGISTIKWR